MKIKTGILLAAALMMVAGTAMADRKVEDYSETINHFRENPTVGPMLASAYGYAVFPTIGKGGIGIGGSHGKGQVYRGGKVVGFTSLTDISIGFQLGGQAYSQVVLFENQPAFEKFTNGNFEFGADASAVALTASAQASAGTEGSGASAGSGDGAGTQKASAYHDGIAVFTIAKGGLMYQAAIAGQKYSYKAVE